MTDPLDEGKRWLDEKGVPSVGSSIRMVKTLVAEVERLRAERDEARGALWRACHDAWPTADSAMRNYLNDARAALHPQEQSNE